VVAQNADVGEVLIYKFADDTMSKPFLFTVVVRWCLCRPVAGGQGHPVVPRFSRGGSERARQAGRNYIALHITWEALRLKPAVLIQFKAKSI
jgi:hypothetical protein